MGASRQTCHAAFGDVFSVIGVREPQPAASEAFVKFADAHRSIEKFGIRLLKTIKPVGPSECSMPHWPEQEGQLSTGGVLGWSQVLDADTSLITSVASQPSVTVPSCIPVDLKTAGSQCAFDLT